MVGNLGRRRARMYVLQIEHPIRDFETWKAAFERFSDKRRHSGVRRHQIFQPADDENYVVLDLECESEGEADAFLGWLRSEVWSSREASPALAGGPKTRIAKVMETQQY
jgi:hypothetical protein